MTPTDSSLVHNNNI